MKKMLPYMALIGACALFMAAAAEKNSTAKSESDKPKQDRPLSVTDELFQKFDVNKDGVLSKEEFAAGMKELRKERAGQFAEHRPRHEQGYATGLERFARGMRGERRGEVFAHGGRGGRPEFGPPHRGQRFEQCPCREQERTVTVYRERTRYGDGFGARESRGFARGPMGRGPERAMTQHRPGPGYGPGFGPGYGPGEPRFERGPQFAREGYGPRPRILAQQAGFDGRRDREDARPEADQKQSRGEAQMQRRGDRGLEGPGAEERHGHGMHRPQGMHEERGPSDRREMRGEERGPQGHMKAKPDNTAAKPAPAPEKKPAEESKAEK